MKMGTNNLQLINNNPKDFPDKIYAYKEAGEIKYIDAGFSNVEYIRIDLVRDFERKKNWMDAFETFNITYDNAFKNNKDELIEKCMFIPTSSYDMFITFFNYFFNHENYINQMWPPTQLKIPNFYLFDEIINKSGNRVIDYVNKRGNKNYVTKNWLVKHYEIKSDILDEMLKNSSGIHKVKGKRLFSISQINRMFPERYRMYSFNLRHKSIQF